MKKINILLFLILSQNAFGFENPYKVLDKSYKDTTGSEVIVKDSSAIKSQDGIGICYGFTTTSLLENYRCKELKLDCSDPHEALSTFDVTSFAGAEQIQGIRTSGHISSILKNYLKKGRPAVAREKCAPFSSISNQASNVRNAEVKGLLFLSSKWNEFKGLEGKKQNDCVTCLVRDVQAAMGKLETSADQLTEAFNTATNVDEFLYKSLLPKECLQDTQTALIPEFQLNSFPKALADSTDEAVQKKIESVLLSGTPVELGICADRKYTPNCQDSEGHSIALFGIKESCNKKECRTVVKVKNSYGESWQKKTNDGWVDLKELVRSSNSINSYANVNWITRPGVEIPDTVMKKSK